MRILLVEDEKELSDALIAVLRHNNYSVDAVYDGAEAMEYLASENYDGVILDVMMPKMDGIAVLNALRGAKNTVPVLMLTAKAELDDKVLGLDSGADDYLTKPFATKELLARLRSVTRRSNEAVCKEISVGNISLNTAMFVLKAPQGEFRLSNKEFQMLLMLMVNPNVLISTEKFMEKIWGCDSDAEINVVWVYISYLRKKLKAIGANVQIKASRNTGYTLAKIL